MPRRIPKYVRHKARNKGKVTFNGKTHYLPGVYNSEESHAEYDRLVAEFLSKQDTPDTANVTFRFLAASYTQFCNEFYVDAEGKPSEEGNQIRRAIKPLLSLFGREPVNGFGPRKLKQVREKMIAAGLYRNTINDRISRILRMLSWAVSEEYLNPQILNACREVRSLQVGKCGDVPEGQPVQPVDFERIEAVRQHLGPVVSAMVDLELLTGMRPQEVRNMTWGQIDRSDPDAPWCYVPVRHKTKHRGKTRRIFIGPKGQAILGEFLKANPSAIIFSPRDSEALRRAQQREARKSPLTPSQRKRDSRLKKRQVAEQYTKDSYRRAIIRGCEKAFGMPDNLRKMDAKLPEAEKQRLRKQAQQWRSEFCWSPNQLRHSCGTLLRQKFGIDAARTVLGHTDKRTTEIYAERDFSQAKRIMAESG